MEVRPRRPTRGRSRGVVAEDGPLNPSPEAAVRPPRVLTRVAWPGDQRAGRTCRDGCLVAGRDGGARSGGVRRALFPGAARRRFGAGRRRLSGGRHAYRAGPGRHGRRVVGPVRCRSHSCPSRPLRRACGLAAAGALRCGWGGAGDEYPPFVRAVEGGETVRGLRVVATPGHTAGHLCLFDEDRSTLFSGDAVGSQAGLLTQGPRPFIADPEEAMRSLRLLSALGAHRMLFGHGGEVPDPAGALMAFIASEGLQT
ncbi:MAG: MBL fold metallo-hydrolase [Lapillicoccus sp.]